jgi:hypothetical protein
MWCPCLTGTCPRLFGATISLVPHLPRSERRLGSGEDEGQVGADVIADDDRDAAGGCEG